MNGNKWEEMGRNRKIRKETGGYRKTHRREEAGTNGNKWDETGLNRKKKVQNRKKQEETNRNRKNWDKWEETG